MPNNQYENLLREVFIKGKKKTNRTGVQTKSIFGAQLRFDLNEGYPLITSKKVNFRSMAIELLWFLSGDTNSQTLEDQGVNIWKEWRKENGDLGKIYGKQWRDFGGVDQISELISSLKETPDSRRHIIAAWNPPEIPEMALAPCHCLVQFDVTDDKLSCQLYQRSADMFLGVPFNIASYSLLTHMISQQVGLEVGEFIWTGGDIHIYENHTKQVEEQLSRTTFDYPELIINRKPDSIFDYKIEDFEIKNYQSHSFIKGEVAV